MLGILLDGRQILEGTLSAQMVLIYLTIYVYLYTLLKTWKENLRREGLFLLTFEGGVSHDVIHSSKSMKHLQCGNKKE